MTSCAHAMNFVRLKNRIPTKLNSTMPVSTVNSQLPYSIKLPAAQVSRVGKGRLMKMAAKNCFGRIPALAAA